MYTNIKTFEDACVKLGIDPAALPAVSMIPEKHQKHIIASYKLVIIAQALNDGWEPDWDNYSEWKYAPWFRMSGSGFSCYVFGLGDSRSYLGSRLCYQRSSLAESVGKEFLSIYEKFITK